MLSLTTGAGGSLAFRLDRFGSGSAACKLSVARYNAGLRPFGKAASGLEEKLEELSLSEIDGVV